MQAIARNTGLAEARLQGAVEKLRDLKFGSIDAQRAVAQLASTGVGELVDRMDEFRRAARDFSVVSGNAQNVALEGILGGILKGEVDLLESQGVLLKFEDGYRRVAAAAGVSSASLSENAKLLSRANQFVEKATSAQGSFEASVNKSSGALRQMRTNASLAFDELARFADPGISAGARLLGTAFGFATAQMKVFRAAAELFKKGDYVAAIAAAGPLGVGVAVNEAIRPKQGDGAFAASTSSQKNPILEPPRSSAAAKARKEAAEAAKKERAAELAGVLAARQQNEIDATIGRGKGEVNSANAQAAIRASDLAISEQERIFENLRRQADGVFDALFLRTQSLGDFFKTTLLTALKSVSSNFTANVLSPLFGGVAGGGGGGGPLGSLFGIGLGSIGRRGAPGGTPGFAGPVAGVGSTGLRLGGAGGGLGVAGAGAGLAGLLASGGLLGGAGVLSARLGGSNPFVRGAVGAGAGAGLGIGTVGLLGQLTPGLLATGPLGALIIGGGIGVGALLNGLLPKAKGRLKKAVLSAYGVRIEDNGVAGTLLGIAKSSGGIDVGIRTPAAKELIESFALATGQSIGSGIVARTTPALFTQRAGTLFAEPTFFAGRPQIPETSLPVFPVGGERAQVVSLDRDGTLLAIAAAATGATSPAIVAERGLEAQRRSIGRVRSAALALEPTTVLV